MKNPRWQTAAFLKRENTQLLGRASSNPIIYIYIYNMSSGGFVSISRASCYMPDALPTAQPTVPSEDCKITTATLQEPQQVENLKVLFIIITQICYSCYLQ